jgi:hypothetical protein
MRHRGSAQCRLAGTAANTATMVLGRIRLHRTQECTTCNSFGTVSIERDADYLMIHLQPSNMMQLHGKCFMCAASPTVRPWVPLDQPQATATVVINRATIAVRANWPWSGQERSASEQHRSQASQTAGITPTRAQMSCQHSVSVPGHAQRAVSKATTFVG